MRGNTGWLKMHDTTSEILETYAELIHLQGLAYKTVNSYKQHIKDFFIYNKDLTDTTFCEYMLLKKAKIDREQLSKSHYNQVYYAFKKYYDLFYKRELPRTIKPLDVPFIPPEHINKEKITEARNKIKFVKHKIMFDLAFASLMRRGEIQKLKIKDIDFTNLVITIRNGKGGKNRQTILSPLTVTDIKEWLGIRHPREQDNPYLFSQYKSPERYISGSTVLKTIKKAAESVGEDWGTHLMRHAGTSVLGEADVNARKIQDLLGHSKLETTQRYLNVLERQTLKVTTPLDRIMSQKKDNIPPNK